MSFKNLWQVQKLLYRLKGKIRKNIQIVNGKLRYAFRSRTALRSDGGQRPIVICAIAKDEEDYLREWVEYHIQLGFDKIFLGDNNDVEKPSLEPLLADFIASGKLEIFNIRGQKRCQLRTYQAFYRKHFQENLWCAFIDIDEFITLESPYTTIRDYINAVEQQGFSEVILNWVMYGDNGKLHAEPGTVQERFPNPTEHPYLQSFTKSISYLPSVYCVTSAHFCYSAGKVCQSDFQPVTQMNQNSSKQVYKNAFVRHYFTKTLEEFLISKLLRGCCLGVPGYVVERLNQFYQLNERTPEKTALEQEFMTKYFPQYVQKDQ